MKHDMSLITESKVVDGDSFASLPQNGNDAASMLLERRISKDIEFFIHDIKRLRIAVDVDKGDIYIDPKDFRDTFASKRLKMALCATNFSKLYVAITGVTPPGEVFDYTFMDMEPGCPDDDFESDLLRNLTNAILENILRLNDPFKARLRSGVERFFPFHRVSREG